ncbi:RIP metalloprotease RseP [Campylobacter canadensis]|uniref:Zinc metalloprotease n=1 Tax=Campylobacter canadensis TaxID=449520 RepID=A0ABS7WR85_9BACT|nr:RIP metalloprotease RseP [Campylobacter canadensis]MBZ7987248.1 RIP metalloprotease RseP [Campylobacter canadensis]MBZ7998323.1 RIP metalloprotease RseP [Campylobacter canadensis]
MLSLVATLVVLSLCFAYWGVHFLATILVLSFLIFFHELGHFLAAKYFKVRVLTFSIGFGKEIFSKEYKGTKYQISSIFLGGYVKMKGQDDSNPACKNYDSDSYSVLHPFKKIIILFAGPFFNFILAFFCYLIIAHLGQKQLAAVIGAKSDFASEKLLVNDKIVSINSQKITSWFDISPLLKENNEVVLVRDGKELVLNVKAQYKDAYNEFGQKIKKYVLGISPSNEIVEVYYRGFNSFSYAFNECINASTLIFKGIYKLISMQISPDNLSGVITMGDITTKASELGLSTLLLIAALISINLGIMNLLPIPVLDGGHIVFNFYELIFKKEVNEKTFEYLSYIGMAFLLSLMLFATYNDVKRIFLPNLW